MDETILLPSPNWFLVSGMAVSSDGWLFYGGPSKSLCVLEPVPEEFNGVFTNHKGYRTHVFPRAHKEKIIAIDVNPMWLESKCIMTGAADGTVKQWTIEKGNKSLNLASTHTNSIHANDQEEVVGVGYSSDRYAVTVGISGKIVKWDLKANIIRAFNHLILSKFRPTCIACSPHILLQVAVGTKQGVLMVVNLVDDGKVMYKVRSHDEEILSMSWCPQYNVLVKKFLRESERRQSANLRMERIRQEAENEESEQFDESGVTKTLPEDSFDDPIVEEDDMFDIYKDHAEEEFGHKKYQPEVIAVKVNKDVEKELDYLAECQKLKDEILKKKNEIEPTINSLVDAFDKAHVSDETEYGAGKPITDTTENSKAECEHRKLPHKHLLATVGKNGNLRVWSKNGKLLGSGVINNTFSKNNPQKVKQPMWATLLWYKPDSLLITDAKGQLLECNPLRIDCKNKLEWRLIDTLHRRGLFCIASNAPRLQNPLQDGTQAESNSQPQSYNQTSTSEEQNVIQQNITSFHLPEDQWYVWTAAQDRNIACYSMTERKKICNYNTCGGVIYTIEPCPYDARKVAFSVGDGAIRVWEADLADDDDTKMTFGSTTCYWQNVQGKVLTIAWHPTNEHLLAFGTAESRVGIVDTSGKCEKPARLINMGTSGSVYCLSWGEHGELYACADGVIILHPRAKEAEPKTISVKLEGQVWQVTSAKWFPAGMMCGSFTGSVALLDNKTYEILAVNFIFKKMIHSIEWHPQFTSNSSEESKFKDMIAVTSVDKSNNIAILKYSVKEDGTKQLETHMLLEGHSSTVLQLAWNPHIEGQLLSSAQDDTARVWDISMGTCKAVFTGHNNYVNGVAWSPFPQLSNVAISGGGDCSVRIWKTDDYPPELYQECKKDNKSCNRRERKKKAKEEEKREKEKPKIPEEASDPDFGIYGEGQEAERMEAKPKTHKKFLLPITARQTRNCSASAVRKLAQKCCKDLSASDNNGDEAETVYDTDFIKLFGTTNELNELVDMEMQHHLTNKSYDSWIMLSIFRGEIDNMIQFAAKHDLLCPFLVSMAPCVSFKYWKDVTALYVAQIDRLIAQRQEHKLMESRHYGGATFRKAALLLSVHDVRGAAATLAAARLHRDAYLLCRLRHMDSIAQEMLRGWVQDSIANGLPQMTVICYLALGEIYKASTTIAGMNKEDEMWLSLAADLAKASGQHTFAGHLEGKKEQIKQEPKDNVKEETLETLATRVELLMRNYHNSTKDESENAETKE